MDPFKGLPPYFVAKLKHHKVTSSFGEFQFALFFEEVEKKADSFYRNVYISKLFPYPNASFNAI